MSILTITLNPAVDLATDCEQLQPNVKLRCTEPSLDPGGGGVNVSRAIKILGGTSKALVAHGGSAGQQLLDLIQREGVQVATLPIANATRQSFAVTELSTGNQFRFVLPGPQWSEEEADRAIERAVAESTAGDCVVLSGSLPPGLGADFYAHLASALAAKGRRVIVDTSGAALEAVVHNNQEVGPCCIRMNRHEAAAVAKKTLDTAAAIEALGRRLVSERVAEVIAIADGANGSHFFRDQEHHFVPAPDVERRSAIGAGDSFVAALTLGLSRDWSLLDIGRYCVAAASAALTTPATDLCDRETADQIFADLGGTAT